MGKEKEVTLAKGSIREELLSMKIGEVKKFPSGEKTGDGTYVYTTIRSYISSVLKFTKKQGYTWRTSGDEIGDTLVTKVPFELNRT